MNHDMVEEDRYDEVVKKPGDEKETPLGLARKVSNNHCPEFRWELSLEIVHRSHACETRRGYWTSHMATEEAEYVY